MWEGEEDENFIFSSVHRLRKNIYQSEQRDHEITTGGSWSKGKFIGWHKDWECEQLFQSEWQHCFTKNDSLQEDVNIRVAELLKSFGAMGLMFNVRSLNLVGKSEL